MSWPACSPDINLIDHALDALGRAVSESDNIPQTLQELAQALAEEWDALPIYNMNKLVEIRLNNKGFTNTNAGVVEIYYNGEWGLVCDDGYWNFDAATVACRQAGFAAAVREVSLHDYYDPTLDPLQKVWLNNVYCYSDEITLDACVERPPTRPATCPGDNFAAVLCADVRLVQTSDSGYSGQVEVYDKGQWYGICGERWGQSEADVVCDMLFPWQSYYPSAQSVSFTSTVRAVPAVRCYSFTSMQTLHDCQIFLDSLMPCRTQTRAAVSCVQDKKKEVDVNGDLKLRALQRLLELLQENKK